ncbi:MAG: hypothetical protein M3142_12645 [Bacteroidota bacterium]|nr:hypothetical protein [Bacteroidota bacterium]
MELRHISTITKEEFIELVKLLMPSSMDINLEEWEMVPYADESPAIAIRYELEEFEIRIFWEPDEPIQIITVSMGVFDPMEESELTLIANKLKEMGFDVSTLES